MKKYVGVIAAGVAGVFTYIGFALHNFVNAYGGIAGYDLVGESTTGAPAGFAMYKIFGIIALIAAGLALVSAVVLLLKELGVIKANFNFGMCNNIVLSVLAGALVLALIGALIFAGKVSMTVSAWLWITVILAACACTCGWLLGRKKA